jgi:uncharacterized RDD family membrane protein YckC
MMYYFRFMKIVGIGTRVFNFLIDTVLIFIITYIVFKIRNWYVFYYHVKAINFGYIFFGVLFIYYSLFEIFFSRTPGKWMSYTKVVNQQNKKPNVGQILLRSLIRITIIDMFFFPFFDKTLHDYLSKTDVVEV